nr:hypothetical protein [uncultured Cohaesibacter sp.]
MTVQIDGQNHFGKAPNSTATASYCSPYSNSVETKTVPIGGYSSSSVSFVTGSLMTRCLVAADCVEKIGGYYFTSSFVELHSCGVENLDFCLPQRHYEKSNSKISARNLSVALFNGIGPLLTFVDGQALPDCFGNGAMAERRNRSSGLLVLD